MDVAKMGIIFVTPAKAKVLCKERAIAVQLGIAALKLGVRIGGAILKFAVFAGEVVGNR
jgi:hypothetical protein